MFMKYTHPFLLDELALRHPQVTIIAAEAGGPWILETLAVAVRHPNVYLDISAVPALRKEHVALVLTLCAQQGVEDRVLFDTDVPLANPGQYADAVRRLRISMLARWIGKLEPILSTFERKVLGDNAARLLGV
jgi:predicted TIM-barrel fold metal-dependent hydrolase